MEQSPDSLSRSLLSEISGDEAAADSYQCCDDVDLFLCRSGYIDPPPSPTEAGDSADARRERSECLERSLRVLFDALGELVPTLSPPPSFDVSSAECAALSRECDAAQQYSAFLSRDPSAPSFGPDFPPF